MLRPRFFCANAFSRTGYTFASPFAIAAGDMTKYFGAGAKVRQLSTPSGAVGGPAGTGLLTTSPSSIRPATASPSPPAA